MRRCLELIHDDALPEDKIATAKYPAAGWAIFMQVCLRASVPLSLWVCMHVPLWRRKEGANAAQRCGGQQSAYMYAFPGFDVLMANCVPCSVA